MLNSNLFSDLAYHSRFVRYLSKGYFDTKYNYLCFKVNLTKN